MSSECPTCGNKFKSERGVKLHHKRSHRTSLTEVEIICYICGEEFTRQQSNVNTDRPCCSDRCMYKKLSEDRDNKVTITCDCCGSKFKRQTSKVKETNYCSHNCSKHGRSKKIKVECVECGDTFKRSPSEINNNNFCSEHCYGKYQRLDEPRKRRLGDWSKKRRMALDRASYTCEHPKCDKNKCANGDSLHVHHIVPNRFTDLETHNMDNLLVLCREHHNELEPEYLLP